MWQPRGECVLSYVTTQAYGPSHLHLDMLVDFLVPQLKVSTLITQQDKATWGYGTNSQRNILIGIGVDMANTFHGFSGLCLEGFVNTEIWVEPRLCHEICESKIYQGVPFCLDVCCIIGLNHMEHLYRDIKSEMLLFGENKHGGTAAVAWSWPLISKNEWGCTSSHTGPS